MESFYILFNVSIVVGGNLVGVPKPYTWKQEALPRM
jgi:hypothetical protein